MPSESRPIILQQRSAKKARRPNPRDPAERQRQLLRGAMVVSEEDNREPKDGLYPNLWSHTAYDSLKFSHLNEIQKLAYGLLDRAVEGTSRVAGLPLKAALAAAQKAGVPVQEIMNHPEQLREVLNVASDLPGTIGAVTGHQPSASGSFLPRGYKEAAVNKEAEKARFIHENMDHFRELEGEVREKVAFSMRSLNPFRKPETTAEHVASAIKGLAGNSSLQELGSRAMGMASKHPYAAGALGAGALAGGMALKNKFDQGQQGQGHNQAMMKAMQMFPELGHEDPEKVQMLMSSAFQVAPNVAQNPLLLGTWVKGLARGYEGTHLSTEDLKRLQDLEVQHVGSPERRQGLMGGLRDATGVAANVANVMGQVSKGQGR